MKPRREEAARQRRWICAPLPGHDAPVLGLQRDPVDHAEPAPWRQGLGFGVMPPTMDHHWAVYSTAARFWKLLCTGHLLVLRCKCPIKFLLCGQTYKPRRSMQEPLYCRNSSGRARAYPTAIARLYSVGTVLFRGIHSSFSWYALRLSTAFAQGTGFVKRSLRL